MLDSRCGGLEVPAKTVVACLGVEGAPPMRTVSTMPAARVPWADWLVAAGLQTTRRPLYRPVGQRPPPQRGARTEDRWPGLRLDVCSAAPRSAQGQRQSTPASR